MNRSQAEITKDYVAVIEVPVKSINRRLGICMHKDAVTCIDFLPGTYRKKKPENAAAKNVVSQLTSYFKNPAFRFSVPVRLEGSDFRKKVWSSLKKIPSGKTRSYGEIANMINSSARAVGGACRDNPVPVIIPCHRVIAQNGFGGYSGKTDGWEMEFKRWLLSHENKTHDNS